MKKNQFLFTALMLGVLATLPLGAALTVSRTKSHRSPAAVSPESVVAQASAPASDDGSHTRIKVRGHWTIDVRDPQGALITHRDFDNALIVGSGDFALIRLLSRQYNGGRWVVQINGLCMQEAGIDFPLGVTCVKTLTLTTPEPAAPETAYSLVLSGNVTAAQATVIDHVQTLTWLCPAALTVAQCAANNPENSVFDFTSHNLVQPPAGQACPPNTACVVNVAAGQSIQVTVTISFS